jgi:hypothetical protein
VLQAWPGPVTTGAPDRRRRPTGVQSILLRTVAALLALGFLFFCSTLTTALSFAAFATAIPPLSLLDIACAGQTEAEAAANDSSASTVISAFMSGS